MSTQIMKVEKSKALAIKPFHPLGILLTMQLLAVSASYSVMLVSQLT